jgi:hypothetical protein
MAWVAVAVAGTAVASTAVSARSARKSASAAAGAAKNELGFAQAQYADWLDVFGDIQTNLGEYYENLTPDLYETQALQAFEQEKQLALDALEIEFAQRGIDTSGLAKETYENIAFSSAAERAKIRAEAPIKTAQVKQEFLQIGLGQNPADNVHASLLNRTNQLNQDARLASQAAGKATGAAVDTTFDALTKLLKNNSTPDTTVIGAPTGNPNSTVASRTV